MNKIFILLCLFLTVLKGDYQRGDPVVYSRYFTQITGIDEVLLFRVLKYDGKMLTVRDSSGGKRRTHRSSVQPIFDWGEIFSDRTICSMKEKYFHEEEIDSISLKSEAVSGLFRDTVCFTGQEYELKLIGRENRTVCLTMIDTFHYKNVGPRFHGVNDGTPDEYIIKSDDSILGEGLVKDDALFLSLFLKTDALKLYRDETLRLFSAKK